MISRHWRGIAHKTRAEDYIIHLRQETIPALATISGFKKASVLSRNTDGGIEFLVITEWESLDAIKAFAGEEPAKAVVPEKVQAMMIDYDREVIHYEIVEG
jgi:heme-degrading monooxygenase HmoA